jgi:hypothetical protein
MNEFFRPNCEDHSSISAEHVRWVTHNVKGGDNKGAAGSGDRALEIRMAKLAKAATVPKTRRGKISKKLENVRSMGYIAPGRVSSLTSFFAVDKGESDIRMVYDATKSGFNDAIWAPSFGLSTVESTFRSIERCTNMGDLDLGEMCLNFKLHGDIRPYAGVDLTTYVNGDVSGIDDSSVCWERWERCLMGLKPSPYNAT